MSRSAIVLGLVASCLGACARLTDHVVLLPDQSGRTGSLTVATGSAEIVLAEAYSGVDVAGGQLKPVTTSAQMVREAYGRLLDMQPARPRILVLHFEFGTNTLTAESRALLPRLRSELLALPAGEAVVIGHTDRVGGVDFNDRLSLQRAGTVRDLLVAAGIPREAISVVGRGERQPVVITADGVAEPRNRRVEIKLR